MAKDFPSDKLDQYMVRFPDGMRDDIKAAATENKRSINAEIIARLEGYDSKVSDIIWLKKEMARLREERDQAQKANREYLLKDSFGVLSALMPRSLVQRISEAADAHGRDILHEMTLALEVAFPPKSADDLINTWEALLAPFERFLTPESPLQDFDRKTFLANAKQMIQFFKEERDAGRGGDLMVRYGDEFEMDENGLMHRKVPKEP